MTTGLATPETRSSDTKPEPTPQGAACAASCPATAPCAGQLGGRAVLRRRGPHRTRAQARRMTFLWLVMAILTVFAVLFVGGEVLQNHFVPHISVAWAHASLTLRAVLATAVACTTVFLVMQRQQHRLSATADQLARLLESYQRGGAAALRFDNPHRVHCREIVDCDRESCPVYAEPRSRCWQHWALTATDGGEGPPRLDIEACHQCDVYRASCPDKLTELGESFNNLMFLLQAETERLDRLRGHMIEKEKMVALGQLAAGIAHEVGNPLSSISSIIQMLKRSQARAEEGHANALAGDQLDVMETHVQRISKTVRQMVSLARPRPEHWEAVDLRSVLEQVISLVAFDRRARDVNIEFSCPEPLPPTRAVADQLQQVFLNLAINALDAMPDGGRLAIAARKNCSNLIVQVSDTGSGIDTSLGRRVFEPFFTTKEPGSGSGLGLSVSYGIIHKHGGTIDFESRPGSGTAFTIQLPIMTA